MRIGSFMLLSFVVPVYNVESYLEDCIKSLICQSGNDFEIILVDDGSTDKSGVICDKYARLDSRVVSYHKINGGLSDARNYGIKRASGKYLAFVDSDDFVGERAVETLREILKDNSSLDVIFMEAFKFYDDRKKLSLGDGYIKELINDQSKDNVLNHLSTLNKFPASAWSKIVNREFLIRNNLYFVPDLLSEDVDWSIRVFLSANSFWYSSYGYYFYRQNREGSITNCVNSKRLLDLISIIENHSKHTSTSYQEYVLAFLAYELAVVVLLYSKLSPCLSNKDIAQRIKNLSWILSHGRTKKVKLVNLCYSIMGLEATSHLLNGAKYLIDKYKIGNI